MCPTWLKIGPVEIFANASKVQQIQQDMQQNCEVSRGKDTMTGHWEHGTQHYRAFRYFLERIPQKKSTKIEERQQTLPGQLLSTIGLTSDGS